MAAASLSPMPWSMQSRGPSATFQLSHRGANAAAAAAAWRYATAAAWRQRGPAASVATCNQDSSAFPGPAPNLATCSRGGVSSTGSSSPPPVGAPLPLTSKEAQALAELRKTTLDLKELRGQWEALPASGGGLSSRVPLLLERDKQLRDTLKACPFGDPARTTTVPRHHCDDSMVSAHNDATQAHIEAELARVMWEVRCVEKFGGNSQGKPEDTSLAPALVNASLLRLRLFDIEGAYELLQRAYSLGSSDPRLQRLLSYCAQLQAPRDSTFLKEELLVESHNEALLRSMREVFMEASYNVATILKATKASSMSEFIFVDGSADKLECGLFEAAREANPMSREEDFEPLPKNLVDLVRIFLLHRILPMSRLCLLFGSRILELLLILQVVVAVEGAECRLVSPPEAVAALRADSTRCGALLAFSNVTIWPVEEDLLIATDCEKTFSSDELEPIMYLSEDSIALLSGAPREKANRVLDVCCGSGVQGITAARYYADEVVFTDLNPRASRFTRFNLALNGLTHKAKGFHLSNVYDALPANIGEFDAIIANPPFVPNPKGIASGGGAMFGNGGETGEQVLAELVKGAHRLLLPGGRLSTVSMAPNVEGMPARIEGWYAAEVGSLANCEALVFRGTPTPAARYQPTASPVETQRYQAALQQLGITTLSEVIMVLIKGGPGAMNGPQASLAGEPRDNLWMDTMFLRLAVRQAMPSLQTDAMLATQAARRAVSSLVHDKPASFTPLARDRAAPPPTPPPPPRRTRVTPAPAEPRGVPVAAPVSPSKTPANPPLREGHLPGFQPGFFPAHCQGATPDWEEVARELAALRTSTSVR